jgi:predicted Fe-Mo cluster-binding NifX family protein
MRYAIPVNGGMLASHFGHCEGFSVFDVDDDSHEILAREFVQSPGHAPGVLPAFLAEQGVSAVIAGGMGSRAVGLFEENRIEVFLGAPEGDAGDIMTAFIEGTLEAGDNVCDH